MKTNRPLVTLVIPNWNGEKVIGDCLEAVRRQTYRHVEVLVLDDCSTDGSVALIEEQFPFVRLVKNTTRLGFAGNANKGFALARGDYIATLDNDAVPRRDWLEKLVRAMERYGPRTAVVEGAVVHGEEVGVINGSLNLLSSNTRDVFGSDLTRKFYPGFCSSIMRARALEQWYDPDYYFFQAEPYLGWLARLNGYEVRREPESVVGHHGSLWRKDRAIRKRYELLNERYRLLNMLLFYETGTLLKVLPVELLFSALRFFSMARKEPWKSWYILRAHAWPVLHPLLVRRKRRAIQQQRRVRDFVVTRELSCRVFPAAGLNRLVATYCRLVRLETVETP